MNTETGIELIARERQEQITKHGRTIQHDVECNNYGQLSWAASQLCLELLTDRGLQQESNILAIGEMLVQLVPDGWDKDIFMKMMRKSHRERLIIAGALIAAEIDRIDNIEKFITQGKGGQE